MYLDYKYDNVIISDNILVGIGRGAEVSSFAPIQQGLKNASSLQARIRKKYKQTVEMTNTPYSNFEILGYYTYKSSEYVYIQDQRGIKIQVALSYFFDIINELTIINGRIANDCVWACHNSNNILVPVDSKLYKMCKENTERKTSRTSIKDIKFGDKCSMEDGRILVYLGYFGYYSSTYKEISTTKKHIFLRKGSIEIENQPTVSQVLKHDTIDKNGMTILEYANSISPFYAFVPTIKKNISYDYREGDYINSDEFKLNSSRVFIMIKDSILYTFKIESTLSLSVRTYFLKCTELNIRIEVKNTNDIVDFFTSNEFKKAERITKVIDPETNKEIEINIFMD